MEELVKIIALVIGFMLFFALIIYKIPREAEKRKLTKQEGPPETRPESKQKIPRGKYICSACGYVGKKKKRIKGSFWTEVALWIASLLTLVIGLLLPFLLFFGIILIVISFIYSVYRCFFASTQVCPKCGNENSMVPLTSPLGKQLYKKLYEHETE